MNVSIRPVSRPPLPHRYHGYPVLQWVPEAPPQKRKSRSKKKQSLLAGFGSSSLITGKIDEDVSRLALVDNPHTLTLSIGPVSFQKEGAIGHYSSAFLKANFTGRQGVNKATRCRWLCI